MCLFYLRLVRPQMLALMPFMVILFFVSRATRATNYRLKSFAAWRYYPDIPFHFNRSTSMKLRIDGALALALHSLAVFSHSRSQCIGFCSPLVAGHFP